VAREATGRTEAAAEPVDRLLATYRWMVLSRELERACCRANPRWFPAQGEEAAIVGAFHGLRPDDVIAPHYRGPFVVYLMRGAELDRLVGQALGKANGYSRGRSVPFTGPFALNVVPWVAGDLGTSLSVATGAALSIGYRREAGIADDRVVVLSFGDGTANRGDFHEALNLAALWKLPIVFVCQNNGYAISLPLATYLAGPSVAGRAAGYGIPGKLVDGNDPLAVNEAVQEAVARARGGAGPSLIEAQTYRLTGHWAEDVAAYRPPDELGEWREKDPLPRARGRLISAGVPPADLDRIEAEAGRLVEEAFARVRSLPDAGPDELGLDEVFAR
jgi:acetoin:2,6-dichlorophenolindophenol oxidoreductase subunit alpha